MISLLGFNINLELTAVIVSLILVFFQIFQSSWLWLFSILSAALYAILYAELHLYVLLVMEVYMVVVSVYGLVRYLRVKDDAKQRGITETIQIVEPSRKKLLIPMLISVLVVALCSFANSKLGNPHPLPDSFLGVSAMLGTFYLSRQYIENWYVWLVGDSLSVIFYICIGLYWTAFLYAIYVVSSIVGLTKWKKEGIRI